MRRGHAGIGGWRNENPRHFRPRSGGPPLFRPNRNYPLQDTLRFPPPGPRPLRGQFINRPVLLNTLPPDIHDRNTYRQENRSTHQFRPQDRSHHQGSRSYFPIFDRMRHDKDQGNQYEDKSYYGNSKTDPWRINSLGDVDDRQLTIQPNNSEHYGVHPISPWNHPPDNMKQYFDDRTIHKPYRHNDITETNNKIPVLEYSGHRPPSSDHYGGTLSSTLDNSNSFSRSVDDTVDIIRKRLQNRGEPHQTLEEQTNDNIDIDDRVVDPMSSNYQNIQQNQPVKRRVQKQKQNVEANCDKMKNKIVHELFKMDKDKIHKLMDNPSSSSKFEYALNSFITESQNSLNRHLRSVAEKSLCTSEEFVHNDKNTIYEDTFMKQMQGILDPQDTVLLEDIKPLVLAELSKVLQLNEYDQPFQVIEDQGNYQPIIEQPNFDSCDSYNYEEFPQSNYYDQSQSPSPQRVCSSYENPKTDNDNYTNFECDQPEQPKPKPKPKPLFERRSASFSTEKCSERNLTSIPERTSRINAPNKPVQDNLFPTERRHSRRSLENKLHEEIEPSIPLFDSNAEQLSDDEDPFAELDKQYHVAVDHNFIETYGISSPQPSTPNIIINQNTAKSQDTQYEANIEIRRPSQDTDSLKQEIDYQLFNIAKSPLKLSLMNTEIPLTEDSANSSSSFQIKQEFLPISINIPSDNCERSAPLINIKQESSINADKHTESAENFSTPVKTSLPSNTRKRSVDQKPPHRKEKRKKSDSSQSDSSNQIMNKNIIINVTDCLSKDTEKCTEAAKSVFNLYFSKDDTAKNTKQIKSVEKSDKFDKRKETQKTNEKEGEKEHKKRQRSVSSSHSTVSPKEKDNVNNNSRSNKSESKTKLQSIDMFTEQPRKVSSVHLVHKNTTACPNTPVKEKTTRQHTKPVKTNNKKISTKHTSTNVLQKTHAKETQTIESKSVSSRFCQTEKKKMINRLVQTSPVCFEKPGIKATDAFERMKEIDMEIQNLLQEKFKLYNCIKTSDPCSSTIQGLGVTVVNVTPDADTQENDDNEVEVTADDIIEDFTNIPVEELEQIALESVQDENGDKKRKKRNRRQKILEEERASSSSPTTRKNAKKCKTPNISLLEQIITDDRPLEDIISLDDLESTPVKNRKQKRVTNVPKRKIVKKSKIARPSITDYNLKECSVIITREDFSMYHKPITETADLVLEKVPIIIECAEEVISTDERSIVEETIENDLQFDMLDVSEDIVIGDNCEIKSHDDKDVERTEMAATEEIILDNSQSLEPVPSDAGQGEEVCKMYDYSTDESLRRDTLTVTGHADAVLAIECIENSFIAACLDGNVYHFSNDGQLIATLRGSNLAVTCLTIVKEKYGITVYTGSLDSRIRYYDLDTGLEKGPECNVLSPIQTMDRAWDTIFVGTRTGFVLQFECKNNMLIPVSTVKFSDQSILALRAMKEGPRKVLLVAARSEDVTIKDAQTGLLLRTLQGPKMTVYTLLYEDGKIYCGTSSHQIHVFDYASGSHVGAHEGGKGAVCLRATGGLVFAGCYDGCVYIYREGSPRPRAQLRGPGLMLLSLCVQGSRIIAGYKDRSLYIWKIPLSILQEMIL